MTQSLSLYVIEDGLAELLLAQEETAAELSALEAQKAPRLGQDLENDLAEARNALAVVQKTLAEYLTAEVRKVDNYHRFFTVAEGLISEMKDEEARIARRRRRMESAVKWLKTRAADIMKAIGKKRLDGHAGRYLLLKGNGGVKPLVLDDWDQATGEWRTAAGARVLPEEMCETYARVRTSKWGDLCMAAMDAGMNPDDIQVVEVRPNQAWIREALASGPIPGARLAERGEHVEVK